MVIKKKGYNENGYVLSVDGKYMEFPTEKEADEFIEENKEEM